VPLFKHPAGGESGPHWHAVRMQRRIALVLAFLAGCGGRSSSARKDAATPTGAAAAPFLVVVPPEEPIGWLAFSPARAARDDVAFWLPIDDSDVLLPSAVGQPEPAVAAVLTAVPVHGPARQLTAGERRVIRYGCDENSFEAMSLQVAEGSEPLTPGLVWILPPTSTAATWKPASLEIASTHLDPGRRAWTTGPLTIALTVTDSNHATLGIVGGVTWLMQNSLERPKMAGAPENPIDLTQDVPGMPSLEAAFTVIPEGAILLVFSTPGYEGTTLSTMLYDGTGLRAVAAMQHYLYACAF
jgi:hypothetical protein